MARGLNSGATREGPSVWLTNARLTLASVSIATRTPSSEYFIQQRRISRPVLALVVAT